jgi:hypothetical protein
MARQACDWAWVGTAKAPSNHARVAVENPSSASALLTGSANQHSHPSSLPPPTDIPVRRRAPTPPTSAGQDLEPFERVAWRYPAVALAPCTDPVSCPLVARTSQITVRVPACQATESG